MDDGSGRGGQGEQLAGGAGLEAFVAARAMVGVRFRAQGRDTARGLDCVGLVWAAYAAAKVVLCAPQAYPLRGWSGERILTMLAQSGLVAVGHPAGLVGRNEARPLCRQVGDVLLCHVGAGQFHLGLGGDDSVIHAHAGLRRVVERPWDADWDAAAIWRLPNGGWTA